MDDDPDGSYALRLQSGPYVTFQSGHFIVMGNQVSFRVEDWEPKMYLGRPMTRPPSGTYYFQFQSPSVLVIQDANLGGVETLYRR